MQLNSKVFDRVWDLEDYVNNHEIKPEQIQQITHVEYLAGWSTVCQYTLFYWG